MTAVPQGEVQLVSRLQAGHADAFTTLYKNYASALLWVLIRLVDDRHKAEDLLQEAFLKIWTQFHRYDPTQGRLYTWLVTITRHVGLDELRRGKSQTQSVAQIPEYTNDWINPVAREGMLTGSICDLLPTKYGQVAELAYMYGLSHSEIAQELGLPLGTVKTRSKVAIQKLQQVFKQDIHFYQTGS